MYDISYDRVIITNQPLTDGSLSLSLSESWADDNYDPDTLRPQGEMTCYLLLDVNHIVAVWIMVCLIRPPHVNPASINNPVK